MSNIDRLLNPWAYTDEGPPAAAPEPEKVEPQLSTDALWFVPAHPHHPASGRTDIQGRIVFELLAGQDGQPVPVAFTSLDVLIERLGSAQPWAAARARAFTALMRRVGFGPVYLDPDVDPDVRRWSFEDIAQYNKGAGNA